MSVTSLSLETIPAGTYNVDPAHSNVGFEVRHMGIATVRGAFRKFQGTLDATGAAPVLSGTVEVASVDTNDPQRDGHLASPDFFDAENYPQITFTSTAGEALDGGQVRLNGEITIKGITKPLELTGVDRRGRHRPVGQRADRPRAFGRDRPPRVRPQVEPDPSEWEPARFERGQAPRGRVGGQGRVAGCGSWQSREACAQRRITRRCLRAAAELAPDGVEIQHVRGPRPPSPLQRGPRHRRSSRRGAAPAGADRGRRRRADLYPRVQRQHAGACQDRGRLGIAPVRPGILAVGQAGRGDRRERHRLRRRVGAGPPAQVARPRRGTGRSSSSSRSPRRRTSSGRTAS